MTVERAITALGGLMIIATSLLAVYHNQNWIWVTLFVGFNLLQSSFTGFCPPAMLMKKLGIKTEQQVALGK